ncbi:peptidase M35 [Cronobacter sakazakii]|nr:peptidase M35 [Cronobacter sakazakii]ELY4533475.1 peptidase M35 [Cronobacter sakazakii]
MSNKLTTAKPSKEDGYIKSQNITNKFNEMIRETLAKQREVLLKRKDDLDRWGYREQQEFKIIFGINDEKARQWVLTGVNKMLDLNGRLKEQNFKPTNENVHAHVIGTQDQNFEIYIGKKFVKDKMTGHDSRVATLCHEMSHYGIIFNSDDVPPPGKDPLQTTPKQFQEQANSMVSKGSTGVMQNAYNLERYFEIE